MKPLFSFLLILSFISCDQAQKKSNNSKIDPSYNPEAQLEKLGIQLPEVSAPVANYVRAVKTGNLLFLSGSGPKKADASYITGKVGADLTIEQGYEAARITGINHLATLKAELGDLKRVKRIVKVLGMVNATPEFEEHPYVINGFSELMAEVFGEENGIGVRSAVGMSLPQNIAVEIEAHFLLEK